MTTNRYDARKRWIDLVLAAVLLVLTFPLQGLIALLVRWRLGSPVLFRQERPGKDEHIFRLLKFRTMREVDISVGAVSDEQRLTTFGSWLRSTSLDELPSLVNVIRGEMSMIGPRPLLPRYLNRYNGDQARRHEVRPGITGLAQVSGRNALTWEARLELDVEYVDNRSFLLDARIALATVRQVIAREGVSAPGEATMTEFMGDPRDG